MARTWRFHGLAGLALVVVTPSCASIAGLDDLETVDATSAASSTTAAATGSGGSGGQSMAMSSSSSEGGGTGGAGGCETTTCDCGAIGEGCCDGQCDGGALCAEGTCVACGGFEEPCCADDTCGPSLSCSEGTCTGCVSSLGGGGVHSCVVRKDGTVWCWGINFRGTLGRGSGSDSDPHPDPGRVEGLSDAALVRGNAATCAITAGGALSCWGDNDYGALGSGTGEVFSASPVPVAGFRSGTTNVSFGASSYACAVRDATLACWGSNDDAQLGIGPSDDEAHPVPEPVPEFVGVVEEVCCGLRFTCAVRIDHSVACWGSNEYGQLANGEMDFLEHGTPEDVVALGMGTTKLAVGDEHACVIDDAQSVRCWGSNSFGEVGTDDTYAEPLPVEVAPVANVADLSAGANHTCAVTDQGALWCWGRNQEGQLGLGFFTTSEAPTQVTEIEEPVVEVRCGYAHTCALTQGGRVWCWGRNDFGQVGTPVSEMAISSPVEVALECP